MVVGLLGRKVGMTQIFAEDGQMVPVTVIEAGPCHVLQVKTQDRDGYEAVQLGYGDKSQNRASRSERGHVAKLRSKRARARSGAAAEALPKAGCQPKRYVREMRGPVGEVSVGQEVKVDIFAEIKAVDVTATSKGRGTSGVIRRHNFSGQRASHGVKKVHRHPGSTGMNTFPHRVFKGKRMAGRYGAERCTVRNLRVVKVDLDNNLLLVYGGVPGPNGGYVTIRQTNKVGPGQQPDLKK